MPIEPAGSPTQSTNHDADPCRDPVEPLPANPANLQQEIGKSDPFDLREQEAFLNLVRTHERLATLFEQFFKKRRLSHAQFNALRILRGHSPKPLPCSVIAREMVTREPDITRLIDRLERAGLAERERCTNDRRVVFVRITDKAREILAELDQPLLDLHRDQLGHLLPHELDQLNVLLFKARHPPSAHGESKA